MVNSTLLTPNSRKSRRKNEFGKERSPAGTNDSTSELLWTTTTASDSKTESGLKKLSWKGLWNGWNWGNFHSFTLACLGVALALSYFYYVTTLFESVTHFSHLSNLERELSLPTDVAFRYSFYKNIADADSYVEGLRSVIYDRKTDWPHSTNSFQKYSLTTEAVLGAGFHLLKRFQEWTNLKLSNCWLTRHADSGSDGDDAFSCDGLGDTLHFYLYSFWAIESVTVFLLFYFGFIYSNSVVGGITTAVLLMIAHPQRSNHEWMFPLKEKIGWAATLVQIFILSHFVLRRNHPSWTGIVKIAVSTAVMILSWESEAQWILISQLLIVCMMQISSFIKRYTAALVIFGQITGWQYATLVSFDITFLHWSFFVYVALATIITIFLVEPILDWVFGEKIDKWIFLRRTILLIAFQMILISVRCDFGRVVGLREDNRFPLSVGTTEHENVNASEIVSSMEQRYSGYFPSASAATKLSDDQISRFQRLQQRRGLFENRVKKIIPISVSSSDENSLDVSHRPRTFFESAHLYSSPLLMPHSHFPTNARISFSIPQSESGESVENEVHSRKPSPPGEYQKSSFIPKESKMTKIMWEHGEKVDDERQGISKAEKRKSSTPEESLDVQLTRFMQKCYGFPLKFSPQVFLLKYLVLLSIGMYALFCGVVMPALICSKAESMEMEKIKKLRSEQRRNGDCVFGSSTAYDFPLFYNCHYRYLNTREEHTFANELGFTAEDDRDSIVNYYWSPVIMYNTCQLGFFLLFCLCLDKRWELLFTSHLCLLLSLLGDYKRVKTVFNKLSCGQLLGTNIHWVVFFAIFSIIFAESRVLMEKMFQNSREKFEVNNPEKGDLVNAVKWIRINTGRSSCFAGVENLMTVVYLSAQRPCVNHRQSGHLLRPEAENADGVAVMRTPLPPQFTPGAARDASSGAGDTSTEKGSTRQSTEGQPTVVFRKPPGGTDSISSFVHSEKLQQHKAIAKNALGDSVSSDSGTDSQFTTESLSPLTNVDLAFEKREKESLGKVYSMFRRRKSISEFHDGLVSLNVSYLFLSREICSQPPSSSSTVFFEPESTGKPKTVKSLLSVGLWNWNWEEPKLDKNKDYAHWQQIRRDCDFISFWDSVEKSEKGSKSKTETSPNNNDRSQETDNSEEREEILCLKLLNGRNIEPFKNVFENRFYTILAITA